MKAPSAQLDQLYAKRAQSWDQGKAYRGHELVAQALRELSSKAKIDILDAGCGTGLVGSLVRDLANILDGVDLSSAMLEKAREKSIYNSLELGDLVSFMNGKPETYDAITCAATLIHFGDLMPAIDAAAVSLRDDGLFVFTLFPNDSHEPNQEVVIAQNGSLARGGCYAHSQGYLRRLAEANEFVVEVLNLDIHEHHNKVVPIWCFVVALRRRCRSN